MSKKQEIRTFDMDCLEVRAAKEGEGKKIRGHAAVFNKLSADLGGFKETIEPGAFADAIKRDDVRALFNHMPSYILGRNKAGTLTMSEDERGLAIEIDPPDTGYARDLMVSIQRGDVNQMSFAFNVDGKSGERWEVDGKEVKAVDAFNAMWDGEKHNIIRHVLKTRLYDVSPVTYPAYSQTDVKVRSLVEKEGIDYDAVVGNLDSDLDQAMAEAREIIKREHKPDPQGAPPQEGRVGSLDIHKRIIAATEKMLF